MSLYALNAGIIGASSGTFCSVSLTSGTLVDGVGQCVPTQLAYTYMSFQGSITFQVPAGDTACGGTVSVTTTVAGSIVVSPPVNVATVITLYGRGTVIGTYNLAAGQSQGQFSFNVSAADAIPQDTYTLPAGQTSGQFSFSVSSSDANPQEQIAGTMKQFIKGGK